MKKGILIFLVGCLLGITSCGSVKKENGKMSSEFQQSQKLDNAEETVGIKISEKVLENVVESSECEICYVEISFYDVEKVKDIFFPESKFDDWCISKYAEDEMHYYYETDKASISVGSSLNYITENWVWKDAFGPTALSSVEGISYISSGEKKDLPFCTIENAINEIKETFWQLGYEDVQVKKVHSIDHKSMQEKESYLLDNKQYLMEQEAGKRLPKKDSWTDEDDGYLFELRVVVNGLPILCGQRILADDSMIIGGEAFVGYGSEGVEYLQLNSKYNITAKETKPVLPYEEILVLLKEKYDNLILDSSTVISDVQLSYYPVIENNQRKLIPAWAFTEETGKGSRYIYLSAIDGTEL